MPTEKQLPEELGDLSYKQAFNFISENYNNEISRFIDSLKSIDGARTREVKPQPQIVAKPTAESKADHSTVSPQSPNQKELNDLKEVLTYLRPVGWVSIALSLYFGMETYQHYSTIKLSLFCVFTILVLVYLLFEVGYYGWRVNP
jgi:hypothetical protein